MSYVRSSAYSATSANFFPRSRSCCQYQYTGCRDGKKNNGQLPRFFSESSSLSHASRSPVTFMSEMKQTALRRHPSTLACREFSTALGNSSDSTTQRGGETKDWVSIRQILFSTAVAFAASATLVTLSPSQNSRSHHDEKPPSGNNGGGGGGKLTNASALYLAEPLHDIEASQQKEERESFPDEKENEGQAPTVSLLQDRRRVYDVSFCKRSWT